MSCVWLGLTVSFVPSLRAGPGAPPPEVAKLFDTGYYRSAVSALEEAASASPNDPTLQYWLGRSFYELHDYGRSVASLEHAVALNPNVSEYHEWLGRACGRKAEESRLFAAFASLALARRVEHEFTTAVRIDANNTEAQRDLIRFLVNAPNFVGGSEERAQRQIQELAGIDALQADLAAAELATVRHRYDEAGAKYQQILTIKPRVLRAYLEIAEYYRQRDDADHIQQTLKVAADMVPADPRLLYYRGVALIMQKQDPARAEDCLRKYLAGVPENSQDPPHAAAHESLGELFADEGKIDQAVAQYRAALILDPRSRIAHDALSRLEKAH